MAASTQSTLESIERRRAQLQESIEKLRKALTHWTTCEAEYETLKEEIQSAGDPSPAEVREIARSLDTNLLDAKEMDDLLGTSLRTKRTANQVVNMISRRIDYVRQNSGTIEKQLDAAEKKLAGVDVLLEPGLENEEGLPMMDIEEELDEAGNEVASSVNQTGKAAAELVEVLRKAGLQKADLEKQTEAKSFFKKHGYNDDLESLNFKSGTKVIELDDDDTELASYPVIPQGESEEDVELRRQMLQYGLSEVGSVVAELDLDNPTVEYSDDDDDYDDETDDEYEDEYGRSLKPAITEDYRKQMLELEKKLKARMLENVGPQSETESLAEHASDIRTLRVHKDEQFDQSLGTSSTEKSTRESQTKSQPKRGVRFADDLDISEVPPSPRAQSIAEPRLQKQTPPTISETIVERPASEPNALTGLNKPVRASRFKRDRAVQNSQAQVLPTPEIPQPAPVPTGPTGRTLANTVVEHDPSTIEPNAPDEFDPVILDREIRTEYNKARNRFIQQKGGFKPAEEDEESPIVEEKNGTIKKVSRFMSARLKANGM
ncbi:hypothetical protein EK21DRAFT_66946 [Setomelanomma holmii]|uniref:DUF3835 domain-containing protein n=1 Tax=Setomelanomma holmii TaxID=210430 RepID=A0A9P4H8P7_9PLEO|nr:hypothetical protein EK21DRAFT_66946 [Setomelanomma holmii]